MCVCFLSSLPLTCLGCCSWWKLENMLCIITVCNILSQCFCFWINGGSGFHKAPRTRSQSHSMSSHVADDKQPNPPPSSPQVFAHSKHLLPTKIHVPLPFFHLFPRDPVRGGAWLHQLDIVHSLAVPHPATLFPFHSTWSWELRGRSSAEVLIGSEKRLRHAAIR